MMIVFAIKIIADDRQSMMRKMVSDLMCTSCKDFQFYMHHALLYLEIQYLRDSHFRLRMRYFGYDEFFDVVGELGYSIQKSFSFVREIAGRTIEFLQISLFFLFYGL